MLIELIGDLGGGKTTFTRELAKCLGVTTTVNSPTYNIYKSYSFPGGKLEHFDLYRLHNDELINNQLTECINDSSSITVVEWAQNSDKLSSIEKLEIKFKYIDTDTREISLTSHGKKSQTILESLV